MPLHPQIKPALVAPDRLNHAIGSGGDHAQPARIAQRLAMMAVDHAATQIAIDLMRAALPMQVGGGQMIRQMLIKHSTMMQPHQLHAQADAQGRLVRVAIERFEQRHFKRLPLRIQRRGLGMHWHTPLGGERIVAAGKNHPIANGQILGNGFDHRRQEQRHATRLHHHRGIGSADLILLIGDLRGDADDGFG